MTWDAGMNWDHISARTTDVMLHEEHLWNFDVLQTVWLSNLALTQIGFSEQGNELLGSIGGEKFLA
jgi:hypothetical protein